MVAVTAAVMAATMFIEATRFTTPIRRLQYPCIRPILAAAMVVVMAAVTAAAMVVMAITDAIAGSLRNDVAFDINLAKNESRRVMTCGFFAVQGTKVW